MLKSFCKFVYILQLKANFKSRPKIKTFYERSGKMFYTIGEMAKKMGVAPSTLRYYDKEGLLPFVERSGGGIRMFKDEDIEWLSIIECLKKTGMPIKEIKQFIDWCIEGDSTIDKRLELIDRRRERVHEQMAQLEKTLDTLDYKHWYYEIAKAAGTCKIHEQMAKEDIPQRMREIKRRMVEGGECEEKQKFCCFSR